MGDKESTREIGERVWCRKEYLPMMRIIHFISRALLEVSPNKGDPERRFKG